MILPEPNDAEFWLLRSSVWNKMDECDKALADANESIRLDSNNADAFAIRGEAWGRKGELDKALEDFDKALRIHPSNQRALHNRSFAVTMKNHAGEA